MTDPVSVIGAETIHVGDEHAGIKGYKVKIIAVLKGGADPDADPDDEGDLELLKDDGELAEIGGVTSPRPPGRTRAHRVLRGGRRGSRARCLAPPAGRGR